MSLSGSPSLYVDQDAGVRPADARANTNATVYQGRFNFHSRHEGNFHARVPAGEVSISATAPGYDSIYETFTVPANQTTSVTLEFLPRLTGTATSYSITRYQTATLTLYGLRADNYTGSVTVKAYCKEYPYESLYTSLKGSAYISTTESTTAYLSYSDGWSYFTGNTVRCSFSAETPEGRRMEITF